MHHTLDTVLSVLVVVVVGAWIAAFFRPEESRRQFRLTAAVIALTVAGLGGVLSGVVESRVRREVAEALRSANAPFAVTVGNRRVEGPRADSILAVLRSTQELPAHNSHPETRIPVRVVGRSGAVLRLELGRDSERPTEYWVFDTGYRHTRLNEIGRVTTGLFSRP